MFSKKSVVFGRKAYSENKVLKLIKNKENLDINSIICYRLHAEREGYKPGIKISDLESFVAIEIASIEDNVVLFDVGMSLERKHESKACAAISFILKLNRNYKKINEEELLRDKKLSEMITKYLDFCKYILFDMRTNVNDFYHDYTVLYKYIYCNSFKFTFDYDEDNDALLKCTKRDSYETICYLGLGQAARFIEYNKDDKNVCCILMQTCSVFTNKTHEKSNENDELYIQSYMKNQIEEFMKLNKYIQ